MELKDYFGTNRSIIELGLPLSFMVSSRCCAITCGADRQSSFHKQFSTL